MRDRGIEIVVALLEKRESILVTRDTSKSFLKELLRAESLGYARKEAKAEVFTLSEKGRRFVNSGYNYLEIENPEPSLPGISPSPQPDKGFPSMHHIESPVLNLEQQKELFRLRVLKTTLFLLAILLVCFIGANLGSLQLW